MLQEQYAVQVVDLVAEGAGEKILAANLKHFALQILRSDRNKVRADDVAAKTGNREAALFFSFFAFAVSDFGIDQNDFGFGVFAAGDVNHGDADALADLRSGKPDALRGIHSRKHVF